MQKKTRRSGLLIDHQDTFFPLARRAIQDCYCSKNWLKEFEDARKECQGFLYTRNGKYLYARVVMWEAQRMLCKACIDSLPESKRKFLSMKYRDKAQLVSISMGLYVSIGQLNLWHQEILSKLTSYLTFQLLPEDIFYRDLVINMVEVIARLIEFFERIDPSHEVASPEFDAVLRAKHFSYRQLLILMDDCIRMKSISPYYEVIAAKLRFPNETAGVLSSICHIDKGIVSRHLRQFSREARQYIDI